MKRFFYLLVALVGLTTFVGCEKDEPVNNLIGTWQVVSFDLYADGELLETEQVTDEHLLIITEETISDQAVTQTYTVEGNNIIVGEGEDREVWEILENTSSTLRFRLDEDEFSIVMNLKRV